MMTHYLYDMMSAYLSDVCLLLWCLPFICTGLPLPSLLSAFCNHPHYFLSSSACRHPHFLFMQFYLPPTSLRSVCLQYIFICNTVLPATTLFCLSAQHPHFLLYVQFCLSTSSLPFFGSACHPPGCLFSSSACRHPFFSLSSQLFLQFYPRPSPPHCLFYSFACRHPPCLPSSTILPAIILFVPLAAILSDYCTVLPANIFTAFFSSSACHSHDCLSSSSACHSHDCLSSSSACHNHHYL